MPITGDNIEQVMTALASIQEKRQRANDLIDQLEAAIVAECAKLLHDPRARAVYVNAKEKELLDLRKRGVRMTKTLRPVPHHFATTEEKELHQKAENVWREMERARCFGATANLSMES